MRDRKNKWEKTITDTRQGMIGSVVERGNRACAGGGGGGGVHVGGIGVSVSQCSSTKRNLKKKEFRKIVDVCSPNAKMKTRHFPNTLFSRHFLRLHAFPRDILNLPLTATARGSKNESTASYRAMITAPGGRDFVLLFTLRVCGFVLRTHRPMQKLVTQHGGLYFILLSSAVAVIVGAQNRANSLCLFLLSALL